MSRRLVLVTEIIAPYRIPVLNELARQPGIDLHVIFLAKSDPVLRQWEVYADEIKFSHQVLRSFRLRFGARNILLNTGVTAAMRRAAPDAVICGGYNYVASWRIMWWCRNNKLPLLAWVESNANDKPRRWALLEFLKTRYLRACRAVVVAGKSSAMYVKRFGVADKAIFVAPNAVDSELFAGQARVIRQAPVAESRVLDLPKRFFLFVGRLVREKGVFDLMEAYANLGLETRTQVGLVMVGGGAAMQELKQLAVRAAPGTIRFPGFVQRDQLAAYYGTAEAFVFPTHSDPWGLVVNEAMACALPIIVTDVAGCVADLVDDRWNGRVVRSRDVVQLASAMDDLAGDSELRRLMGERSRSRIARHSPEACASGIAHAVHACWSGHAD